jgi:hypothetical protein
MTSFLVARSYLLQIVTLNTAGYPIGSFATPNSPVNGTVYPSYIVPGIVSFTPGQPTYEEVHSYAQETMRGRRDIGTTDYGIGQITLAEYDETVNKLSGGSLIDTSTATALSITAPNSNNKTPPRLGLVFTAGATPSDSSENFINILLSNVTLRRPYFGSNQGTGRNPNNLTLDVVISTSTRTLLGMLLSATALSVANDTDTEIRIYSPAPIVLSTYIDDGSAVTRLLPYTPYSTENAGATNIFTKQGVTAHAQVSNISGKTVTFTAGTAANIWVDSIPTPLANIV